MNPFVARLVRPAVLLALATGTVGAAGVQVGVNLPIAAPSVEVELNLDPQNAVGFGTGIVPLTPLPVASAYYRYFPGSAQGGVFFGGRLGTNILITTGTATAGYRFDFGSVYLDGELGVGLLVAPFLADSSVLPGASVGLSLGFRF